MTEEKVRVTQKQLLNDGMIHLDDALANIMELESVEGKVLAEMVHAALLYGEKALLGYID